jgi:glycerol-3-phosphate dehydrogenase
VEARRYESDKVIDRSPVAASRQEWDVIVVGGGIHGAMLALESSLRGYRSLLLERADFGGATSWNSLRIIHGGLRYLQTLDLLRFRRSRWYLQHFPDLVRPLRCLMPLDGSGLRRPLMFRTALLANEILRLEAGQDGSSRRCLPRSRVLSREETVSMEQGLATMRMLGSAMWYDASVEDPARLLMEVLRWACSTGAACLNYVEAVELITRSGAVAGVRALDQVSGEMLEFQGRVVANCAGPAVSEVASRFCQPAERLFLPSLAFNLLLDREPPMNGALAIGSLGKNGSYYFITAWRGLTLAGTYHASRPADTTLPAVSAEELSDFVTDLNGALPYLDLSESDVLRVLPGLLPANAKVSRDLATRSIILDHGRTGGVSGLYSISGVKYTTARRVAADTLRQAFGRRLRPRQPDVVRPPPVQQLSSADLANLCRRDPVEAAAFVERLVREEAVTCIEDLVYRRMDWGLVPADAEKTRQLILRLEPLPIGLASC